MIAFKNLHQEIPYLIFKEKYKNAINAGQNNIEAMAISSFNIKKNEGKAYASRLEEYVT